MRTRNNNRNKNRNKNKNRFCCSAYHISLAILMAFSIVEANAGEQLFTPFNHTWKAVQFENKIFGSADRACPLSL